LERTPVEFLIRLSQRNGAGCYFTPNDRSDRGRGAAKKNRRVLRHEIAIGFIGLGLMGRPMAANLFEAVYDVTVWNRTPRAADELVAQGAKRAATRATWQPHPRWSSR